MKKPKTSTVTVRVNSDQQVIVTSKPKSHQIPRLYFYKWLQLCEDVPVGYWARAGKKCRDGTRSEPILVKIDDMHPAQLWQCIKWCWRQANGVLAGNLEYIDRSPAELLAPVPKWAELLEAAKRKRLEALMFYSGESLDEFADYAAATRGECPGWTVAPWYEKAIAAIDRNKKSKQGQGPGITGPS